MKPISVSSSIFPVLPLASALFLFMLPASAQVVDLRECRAIEDSQERFACYERLGEGEAAGSSDSGDSVASDQAAASDNGARSREDLDIDSFGRSSNPSYRIWENDDGRAEFEDTVAELREIEPNHWLITLESGQRWRQVEGRFYRLREGEKVHIYPSSWGENYRLSSENLSSFIQVRRVD